MGTSGVGAARSATVGAAPKRSPVNCGRPGRIAHADAVQVVAVPGSYPDDWRLGTGVPR